MDMVTCENRLFIVTPHYNNHSNLRKLCYQIDSINSNKIVHVIVDHGSSSTPQITENDNRILIKINRNSNEIRSASRPLNTGLDYVCRVGNKKDVVLRFDSDDSISDVSSLMNALKIMDKYELVNILFTPMLFDRFGSLKIYYLNDSKINLNCYDWLYSVSLHTTLIRLVKIGNHRFREDITYGEDFEFMLRVIPTNKKDTLYFQQSPFATKSFGNNTITSTSSYFKLLREHQKIFKSTDKLSTFFKFYVFVFFFFSMLFGSSINMLIKVPAKLNGGEAVL